MATRITIAPADALQRGPADAAVRFLRPGELRLEALPPLSLYVHFPWCERKCPYCDFNSHAPEGPIPEADYLDALCADLEASLPLVWGRRVHTVFIGGGTPSLLSAAGLDRLLGDLRARLPIDADAEITMEANPGSAEVAKFRAFRDSGVNRLSIGIQSFDDRYLRPLGRIHDGAEARRAAEAAVSVFDNVNLDLMYALPGQSLDDCLRDIDTALGFGTRHLSVYHLTVEPNTVYAKYPPTDLPDDDLAADMQEGIVERLGGAGFDNYEISAWARPGSRSRHNLNYWTFGDYLGIGAGAHGKLSFPERITRQARLRQPQSYMEGALRGDASAESHDLDTAAIPGEFMMNALRLTDGVPTTLFAERTGLSIGSIARAMAEACARGLLDPAPERIRPTDLGRRFLNDLQAMFIG
ncbi:radical SAM family heme chaperone HemW [Derxia gummosa]|uniref:Heme chaperone HemW n=1 Tax=Derxia gummosa DSM 723 TaxID=1121388 RepID=A0A8B6X8A8_9BURK|nr:radical SAM family heme chaperone HemW [Derxia gummosa]